MGFLPSLAKATTVQNDANIAIGPNMQSEQYRPGAEAALANALAGNIQFGQNQSAQQALAGQYQQVAQGQGPNPAQAMLNERTEANIANQAALAAGQRGAGANVGLIARQAGQQGGNLQQQAVGQGATLQAQQSLGALSGLGGLYGQMGNQINQQQNANTNLFGTAAGAQAAQINQQLAAQQANAGIQQANANTAQGALSGLASGAGAAGTSLIPSGSGGREADYEGGMVGRYDNGGMIDPDRANDISSGFNNATANGLSGPKSFAGQYLAGGSAPSIGAQSQGPAKEGFFKKYGMSLMALNKGGKVDAMLSPGEQYLSPEKAKAVANGKADPMSGQQVPGKAKVSGDSLKNDTVPAKLEKGGVVVKRSVMATHDPDKVMKFVQAVMAKSSSKRR